jgi:epidermal growth factor receptor substrate 15
MWRVNSILLFLFLLISGVSGFAQAKNEDDLKKQAAKAFEDEDYSLAFKNYSTLLANYPKDPDYNYRLGVCALYVEQDKKKAIAYLLVAARQPKEVDKEVLFYLGKAYHLNYQFDEAIRQYTQYKETGSSGMQKKLQVDREIQCCKNAKRLLANLQELVVLERKQLSQADYFRSYDLRDIRGKLLAKPSDFTSPNDKKKKDRSIIYLPPAKDQLYYASYGTGENKDIYIVKRMPDGNWGKPEAVAGSVNTEYDEDYPFLHPNGQVLYFASKGHNSMGGYDVFKSELDASTGRWKTPVNLEFPINSPNDDYLFVTDSLEKTAYLASTRQSPMGKVDVYRILTERRSAEYAFIKGTVIKKNASQNLRSKIKVKNIETGEDAGTFVAEENGEYNIKLANGGKFIFTVESPGMPTQSQGVNMPTSYSYKPYRQTIDYDNQKLVITNFFEVNDKDDNNYAQYLALIEEKSKMNVNASDFDINPDNPLANSGNNSGATAANNVNNTQATGTDTTGNAAASTTGTATTSATAGNTNNPKSNVSNKQLIDIAYSDAKEAQQEASELKKDATSAFTAANSKQDQANATKQELAEIQTKLNSETDPGKKQELQSQADKLKQEADLYDKQAKTANTIAQQLEVDATNKQKEADLNLQYAKALEEADKTKNNKQAIAKLEGLQKQLEELNAQKSQSNALVESIKADARNKEQELKSAEKKQETLNKEEGDLKVQLADLDKEIDKTKDKALLENLNAQKEEVTSDLTEKQKELQLNTAKINTLKEESEALNSQADYAVNVATGNTDANTVAATNNTSGGNNNTAANTGNAAGTNTLSSTGTGTTTANSTATNTAVANNTNTATAGTNTTAATNANASASTTAFNEKSKQFDENIQSLNSAGNTLENNKQKAAVLKEYLAATETQISTKKQELAKAKSPADKAAINEEIQQLNAKKSDIETDVRLVTTQVEQQEKFAATNNTTSTATSATVTSDGGNTTGTATVATTVAPVSDTSQAQLVTDNDNPAMQKINTLVTQSQNSFSEEKKLFSGVDYSDPKALQLKQQADQKIDQVYKNSAALGQQLEQLKITVAKENAGANEQKIQGLNKQGDDLYAQAVQLRKDARNLSGTQKQNALSKILALENQAAGFKYQAARLQYQSDDNNYATNKKVLDQLVAQNPDNAQAKELNVQAERDKKESVRLREEAEAQKEVQAKIGALGNADAKEKEALKKQEAALALLNSNSNAASSQNSGQQADAIKAGLDKEALGTVNALKLLADANKAEYAASLSQVNSLEKKTGAKPEATNFKTDAQFIFKKASDEYNRFASLKDEEQKRDLLLAVNTKFEESISQLRQAKAILTGEPIAAINTATVTNNNTPDNTNTAATATNSATAGNTSTTNAGNSTTATNTVSTSSGNDAANNNAGNSAATTTVAATSSNTVSTTPTTTTASLTETQVAEIKNSSDYQKYAGLQKEITVYQDAAVKDEKAAQENRIKYESLKTEADNLPAGEQKAAKEQEAMVYKAKADSLDASAGSNRTMAESKKQESDNFAKSLDAVAYTNISTVAATETTTAAGNTGGAPRKYTNYSETFSTSANQKDEQLASLKAQDNNPDNLRQQNTVITAYIADIDKEVAAKKQEQLAARNAQDKLKISQQIKNLQTRKIELTNEKNSNENALRVATNNGNNTGNTNTASNNTTTAGNANTGANTNTASNTNAGNNTGNNTAGGNVNDGNTAAGNNTTTNTAANTAGASNTTPRNVITSTDAKVNGFEIKNTNAYSAANPIPVDEKLPEGLIFRVQIGAFKNPIPQDQFAGLAPIGAESTNFGFIRYQVGMFTDYQKANAVRNDLRKLKYNDAFVVVYRNGKRISLTEALDSLARIGVDVTTNVYTTAGISATKNIPVNPEANANAGNAATPAVVSGELNQTDGLLFTVQVGVYAENVSADRLLNLKPLYKEALPNGSYRYTAGIYNDLEKVKADRLKVNELGIRDAFVSAYLNGQRVKISEAIDKLNAGGVKLPQESPIQFAGATVPAVNTNTAVANAGGATTPDNTAPVQPFTNGVSEGPAPTPENGVKASEEGITFKVQIGAYRKQVPQAVANDWMKVRTWPVKNLQVNDLYIYTIGSFTEAKFAEQLRREVMAFGITDAFLVVFKDGKKLSFAEGAQYITR